MIKTERITVDGRELVRTYSDAGCYVVREGITYEEAIDPADTGRTYTEGGPIPKEIPTDADYAIIGRIMMGVTANEVD